MSYLRAHSDYDNSVKPWKAIYRKSHSHLCFAHWWTLCKNIPFASSPRQIKMAIRAAHLLEWARGITLLSPFPPRRAPAVNLSRRKRTNNIAWPNRHGNFSIPALFIGSLNVPLQDNVNSANSAPRLLKVYLVQGKFPYRCSNRACAHVARRVIFYNSRVVSILSDKQIMPLTSGIFSSYQTLST